MKKLQRCLGILLYILFTISGGVPQNQWSFKWVTNGKSFKPSWSIAQSQKQTTQYRNHYCQNEVATAHSSRSSYTQSLSQVTSTKTAMDTIKNVYIAGFDYEIYQILLDIQKISANNEVNVYFYLYNNWKYYYVGWTMTNRSILRSILNRYHHCYYINNELLNNPCDWYLNQLVMLPTLRNSKKSERKFIFKGDKLKKNKYLVCNNCDSFKIELPKNMENTDETNNCLKDTEGKVTTVYDQEDSSNGLFSNIKIDKIDNFKRITNGQDYNINLPNNVNNNIFYNAGLDTNNIYGHPSYACKPYSNNLITSFQSTVFTPALIYKPIQSNGYKDYDETTVKDDKGAIINDNKVTYGEPTVTRYYKPYFVTLPGKNPFEFAKQNIVCPANTVKTNDLNPTINYTPDKGAIMGNYKLTNDKSIALPNNRHYLINVPAKKSVEFAKQHISCPTTKPYDYTAPNVDDVTKHNKPEMLGEYKITYGKPTIYYNSNPYNFNSPSENYINFNNQQIDCPAQMMKTNTDVVFSLNLPSKPDKGVISDDFKATYDKPVFNDNKPYIINLPNEKSKKYPNQYISYPMKTINQHINCPTESMKDNDKPKFHLDINPTLDKEEIMPATYNNKPYLVNLPSESSMQFPNQHINVPTESNNKPKLDLDIKPTLDNKQIIGNYKVTYGKPTTYNNKSYLFNLPNENSVKFPNQYINSPTEKIKYNDNSKLDFDINPSLDKEEINRPCLINLPSENYMKFSNRVPVQTIRYIKQLNPDQNITSGLDKGEILEDYKITQEKPTVNNIERPHIINLSIEKPINFKHQNICPATRVKSKHGPNPNINYVQHREPTLGNYKINYDKPTVTHNNKPYLINLPSENNNKFADQYISWPTQTVKINDYPRPTNNFTPKHNKEAVLEDNKITYDKPEIYYNDINKPYFVNLPGPYIFAKQHISYPNQYVNDNNFDVGLKYSVETDPKQNNNGAKILVDNTNINYDNILPYKNRYHNEVNLQSNDKTHIYSNQNVLIENNIPSDNNINNSEYVKRFYSVNLPNNIGSVIFSNNNILLNHPGYVKDDKYNNIKSVRYPDQNVFVQNKLKSETVTENKLDDNGKVVGGSTVKYGKPIQHSYHIQLENKGEAVKYPNQYISITQPYTNYFGTYNNPTNAGDSKIESKKLVPLVDNFQPHKPYKFSDQTVFTKPNFIPDKLPIDENKEITSYNVNLQPNEPYKFLDQTVFTKPNFIPDKLLIDENKETSYNVNLEANIPYKFSNQNVFTNNNFIVDQATAENKECIKDTPYVVSIEATKPYKFTDQAVYVKNKYIANQFNVANENFTPTLCIQNTLPQVSLEETQNVVSCKDNNQITINDKFYPQKGTQESTASELKPLINYINANLYTRIFSSDKIKDCIFNNQEISIPVGDFGIAKYDIFDDDKKTFTMPTCNDNIDIKAWYSKLKIAKVKLVIETTEQEILNFMPVVKDPSKSDPESIQRIAKEEVTKLYGEPMVIKGIYSICKPYAYICDLSNFYITGRCSNYILWPTFCNCGCRKCGCECLWNKLRNPIWHCKCLGCS